MSNKHLHNIWQLITVLLCERLSLLDLCNYHLVQDLYICSNALVEEMSSRKLADKIWIGLKKVFWLQKAF